MKSFYTDGTNGGVSREGINFPSYSINTPIVLLPN